MPVLLLQSSLVWAVEGFVIFEELVALHSVSTSTVHSPQCLTSNLRSGLSIDSCRQSRYHCTFKGTHMDMVKCMHLVAPLLLWYWDWEKGGGGGWARFQVSWVIQVVDVRGFTTAGGLRRIGVSLCLCFMGSCGHSVF
jgi:hypothetical protein